MSDMFDRIHRAEIYAYENDIMCDCGLDYLDCGDCPIPDNLMEASNE